MDQLPPERHAHTAAAGDRAEGEEPQPHRIDLLPLHSRRALDQLWPVVEGLVREGADELVVLEVARPAYGPESENAAEEPLVALPGGPDVRIERRVGHNFAGVVREVVRDLEPDRVILTWSPGRRSGALLDELTLRDLLLDLPSELLVVAAGREIPARPRRLLVPVVGNGEWEAAARLAEALALSAGGGVTLLAPLERDEELDRSLAEWIESTRDPARIATREAPVKSLASGILQTAVPEHYDAVVMAAPPTGVLHRIALGSVQERVVGRAALPVVVIKPSVTGPRSVLRRIVDRLTALVPPVSEEGKAELYRELRGSSRPSTDFFVMIGLAAFIAALGLILGNAAVVIGGMLVAPLMSPILALGLAVTHGDPRLLRMAAGSVLRGSLLAVLVGAAAALALPGRTPTSELLARTEPSLLDLGVAVAAGAAGAYALARPRLAAALPGVAIAVAVVPPLVAAGIMLAKLDRAAVGGAALLFLANTVGIATAAGLAFLWFGFRPEPEHTPRIRFFSRGFTALFVLVVAVAFPLASLGAQAANELRFERRVEAALDEAFADLEDVRWLDYRIEDEGDESLLTIDVEAGRPVEPVDAVEIERAVSTGLARDLRVLLRVAYVSDVPAETDDER